KARPSAYHHSGQHEDRHIASYWPEERPRDLKPGEERRTSKIRRAIRCRRSVCPRSSWWRLDWQERDRWPGLACPLRYRRLERHVDLHIALLRPGRSPWDRKRGRGHQVTFRQPLEGRR